MLDWEGRLASVLFLPSCNFRCGYCHAGYLVARPNEMESIPLDAVLETLRRSEGWIDGVVITGGEPTLHEGLEEFIRIFRSEGFSVKLDTNGSQPAVLQDLMRKRLLDYVAMDVKAPLDERYRTLVRTDCDLEALKRTIQILVHGDVDYEFRTTVCPRYLARDDIRDLVCALRGAKRLILQQFRPIQCLDHTLQEVAPYNDDEMRLLAETAAPYVAECYVRGDQLSRASTH